MSSRKIFSISAVILFALSTLLTIVNWVRADVGYARGRGLADLGYVVEAGGHFEKAASFWPQEPAYHRELAAVYARLSQVSVGKERKQFLELASWEAEKALNLNPLKSLIPTYFALAGIEPTLQFQTESLVEQAIGLCPTDPVVWYLKGMVLLGRKERWEAKLAFEEALRLKPDYGKAREALDAISAL